MKITIKNHYVITENVSDYIARKLDGASHDGGIMEDTEQTAQNVREAFGRLVNILADRDLLSADDVTKIADSELYYEYVRFDDL